MSHPITTHDSEIQYPEDNTEYWKEREMEDKERLEETYDASYEPTCGIPEPSFMN